MEAAEARGRLLAALYLKSRKGGAKYWSVSAVAEEYGFSLPTGFDRMLAERLAANSWVRIAEPDILGSDADEPAFSILTWEGIEAAEKLLEDRPEYGRSAEEAASSAWVPAADRFVSISDNQREQIAADVSELREVVRGANDISETEREIVLYEIAIFEAAIASPRVSSELIQRFVNGALGWIAKTMVNAFASELAKRLYGSLSGLT